jgi:hypothetical protein
MSKIERKKRSEGINTMTTNSKRIKNLQMTTWSVRSLNRLRAWLGQEIIHYRTWARVYSTCPVNDVKGGRKYRSGNNSPPDGWQIQPEWNYKWKWPLTDRLCCWQRNGDQEHVFHVQESPPSNLQTDAFSTKSIVLWLTEATSQTSSM